MKQQTINKLALTLHKKLGGKIRIIPSSKIETRADMSLVYTPGVAVVSTLIAQNPELAKEYTIKKRMVAVVSDGSAVLGLGNIGPYGALPVMEGKAALFKTFADVDAFPIVLSIPQHIKNLGNDAVVEFIVNTVYAISPAFGGINLEDFAAPQCFEIEERLKDLLNIPVMHDDQHGTAIVTLAALINAAKVMKKDIQKLRIVVAGAGAAGTAITKLLLHYGIKDILVVDSKGILTTSRTDLVSYKSDLANITNPRNIEGNLARALEDADAFIGVSGPNTATATDIKGMAEGAIVFALANPTPEIMPVEAKRAGAKIIATGRSDFANQINNSLVFPGVFRGALDNKVNKITDVMKLRAAENLAKLVKNPTAEKIIPDPFDPGVVKAVAKAIK